MKKLLSIVLATVMLLTVIPLGAVSVCAATSGTTGDCIWTLEDGHLTISGSGAMDGYANTRNYNQAPWGGNITSVTIEDGVTNIGKNAFLWCTKLTSVTIGDSVTTIGFQAFELCSRLTSVTIPDSVTTIGMEAFHSCTSLTSINIPDGVTIIDDHTFAGCSSLTSVTIPDSVTTIGKEAFSSCDSLTSINIPDSVEHIYYGAFSHCPNLISVTIGNGVTTIGLYAFLDCDNLRSVSIPVSVTSIGWYAFSGCDNLTDVYYCGSEDDKINITIDEANESLINATWHYDAAPISYQVEHSLMDTANGNGLAFRFELTATGVKKNNRNVIDLSNATIDYLGKECKLVGMGTVVTNSDFSSAKDLTLDAVNDFNVINVPTVYLQEADEDSCAFATRIIDIPDSAIFTIIYVRPYFIVEVDGKRITAYGEINYAACAAYL